VRGDIYSPFAGRAKEYAWSLCLENAPRKITPTDIDYMAECNSHFLFFEMKTEGAKMPFGQQLAFERLLRELPNKGALMLVSHSSVSVVKIPTDVLSFDLWTSTDNGISILKDIPAFMFTAVYRAFFEWAEGDKNAFRRELSFLESW
jgi:hypothetical protein